MKGRPLTVGDVPGWPIPSQAISWSLDGGPPTHRRRPEDGTLTAADVVWTSMKGRPLRDGYPAIRFAASVDALQPR